MSDSDSEEFSDEQEVTEDERKKIREKISTLSFEDLLKMKNEMGSKVYNETVYGVKRKKNSNFKRANKNRPREMSSKVRPRLKQTNNEASSTKIAAPRDPRFDPLCGQFDQKTFKTNYKFMTEIRIKEKKQLEEEYKNTKDEGRKKKIKYLLERISNQIRESEKKEKEEEKQNSEKKEIIEKLKKGEKPVFKKKSVKKLESLIEKYEQLKKNNKLQKHIEKRSKKLVSKERKKQILPETVPS